MNYRIHRTIYVTDLVIEYKQNSMLRWEEIVIEAYNARNINRFISNNEYKLYAKRLSSFYLEEELYERILAESSALHMTFSKYLTLLLHDYVTQQNVSRETLQLKTGGATWIEKNTNVADGQLSKN